MSFSVSWQEVRHGEQDLQLVKATTASPPVDQMADDVKEAINAYLETAADIIEMLPQNDKYYVSINGHVRQGDSDKSFVNLSVGEFS